MLAKLYRFGETLTKFSREPNSLQILQQTVYKSFDSEGKCRTKDAYFRSPQSARCRFLILSTIHHQSFTVDACRTPSQHYVFAACTLNLFTFAPPDSIDESFIGASSVKHLPKHPNIVSLKDTYEDDIDVHIVIELCEGGELFDRIVARRHYTERAAATVMKTIVEVVQLNWLSCKVGYGFQFSIAAPAEEYAPSLPTDLFRALLVFESSSTGNEHRRRNSLESLFCYDTPIPEERIEKSIGVIGDNPRCTECKAKGAVLCATCSSSGLYVDSILESQGIIVKVVGESVILCVLNVVAVVIVHLKKMANDEHLHKAFSFFDRNQSGFIEIKELRNALNDEVDTSSEDVINAIMHDVDTDKYCSSKQCNKFSDYSMYCRWKREFTNKL
ncbi:hypothetical protein CUMW_182440 [Citrus unshiu]|uniref:non-specific serine/threonine protein kinase n=1 Tax=Citrus unshiu TaxID=55188 RepID=A0A2H5PZL2_CITUN|nr:hypothetical protein CUMW_182440 [Citrus unshiu]